MTKKTWQKSHTFLRKALYFIAIAVLISVSLLALPRSTQATDFNYTFDIKKNDQSVLRKTTSGNVSVGINMNSDKDLSNVRFYVDGKLKATRASIVNTGFREFYTWNTREESNGEHTVSIKAVKTNGQEFDVWTTSGNTSSKLTIDNGTNGGTGSGGGGNSGGGGGSGGGSNGSGGNSSSTGAAAEVTAKPKLTVEPGPMAGVAGSKAGTVNGDKVTGGIVFKVKFKRPKTENYDLKTIHVVITKDGQPRITIFNNPDVESSVEVKEEGDFKVYTFMRYYNTVNKPNGVNTWVATFQPSVPTPVGDTQSDPLSLNIDNPNSTAEQTCRELKKEVNNLFDTMTARIDKNQQEVTAVNDRIDSKYRELNLASTNPIPDYDAKKAANSQKSQNVDTKQTDLGALKIQCDSSANVEDVGEKIIAFKLKLEETKASMAEYRSATLDLLGDLRARLPQDGDDNGGPTIPAGFVKYNTPCYSFAARRGFTTDDPATQIKGPCNKEVLFTKTLDNGNSVGGSISPLPWPITDGTLEQNVQQVKNTEIANGSEIIDEKSFQLDGRNAVRFVAQKNIPVGTQDSLHVLVDSPYKVDGKDVGGYDIYVSGYSFTGSPLNVQLGNLVKDATDKALTTWQWKDDNSGGGGNPPPTSSNSVNTKCYSYATNKTHKLISVESDEQGRRFNCIQTQQFSNSSSTKVDINFGGGFDQRTNATAESNVRLFRSSLGLDNDPNFVFTEEAITVDGDPAIKLSLVNRERNLKAVYTFLAGPQFIVQAPSDNRRSVGMKGAVLYYEAGAPNSAKDRFAGNALNEVLASWEWKTPPSTPIAFDNDGEVPEDELSQVACLGTGSDGPRVEVIYLKNEGQSNSDLESPFSGLTHRQFIKRSAARMNREVMQSAQKQDGFRQVRFKTNSDCEVAVKEVVLDKADQSPDFFSVFGKLASKYNLSDPNKKYLVFWSDDNLSDRICGVGGIAFRPGQAPSDQEFIARSKDPNPNTNIFNNSSGLSVFRRPCWFPSRAPGQIVAGDVQLHELMHAFGAVIANSPNSTNKVGGIGHCTDLNDVMCYNDDRPNVRMKVGVCPNSYDGFLMDCKGDDYFGIRPRAGSFLSENWNTANSKWFTNAKGSNQ